MPRRRENGGEEDSGGSGGHQKQSAKEYAEARTKQEEDAIVGKEKTLEQQMEEARGESEGDKAKAMREYTDGADKEAEKLLEEAFPERKAVNIRVEAQHKFNEKFGIDPNAPGSQIVVKISDKFKGKMYKGRLTLRSVHGETGEEIAFPFVAEGYARGEEYLWYCLKVAHPHALRDAFEVDPENKTEPMSRSRFG